MLSLIVGPSGLVATKKIQAATAVMQSNLVNLEYLNSTFSKEWDILQKSSEITALEARSLGYLAENEVAIRLSIGDGPDSPSSAGFRISFEPDSLMTENSIKNIALFLTALFAIIGFVFRLALPFVGIDRHREIRTQSAAR